MRVNVLLAFSFLFILGHQPRGWHLPLSEYIFLSLLNHLRLQKSTQRYVSLVFITGLYEKQMIGREDGVLELEI